MDETGFSPVSPLKRTWAPRGQTPTLRTSLEHNEHVNLVGALCLTPARRKLKLHVHSHRGSIRGEEVVAFLTDLLHRIRGPIVLLWDKHPIHRRRTAEEFLARHSRIHVYAFPTSAPELNPVELVWTQVKEYSASTAPHNGAELRLIVYAGLARTRRSQKRLWACLWGSDLPWKRRSK